MKVFLVFICSLFFVSNCYSQPLRLAILDFDNLSGLSKYDGLGKAMSSMLISDIESNVSPKRLQLVERAQIQKVLKEQNFQASGSVNKNTAVQAGKILGVSYLLLGDVFVLNDALIINARLINTETGNILFAKKQEGKTAGWLLLKTNIAKELATTLSMPFTEPTVPDKETAVAIITTFGNAITAKDNGDVNKAENLIETVKDFSPDFKYLNDLQSQIEELKGKVRNLEVKTEAISKKQNEVELEMQKTNQATQVRFDQIELLIKSASPITNPKNPYDLIANAYIFKNSGNSVKSEEAFKAFIKESRIDKYDVLEDYLEVLKINYGLDQARSEFKILAQGPIGQIVLIEDEASPKSLMNAVSKIKTEQAFKDWLELKNYQRIYAAENSPADYNGVDTLLSHFIKTWSRLLEAKNSLGSNLANVHFAFLNKSRAQMYLDNGKFNFDISFGNWLVTYKTFRQTYLSTSSPEFLQQYPTFDDYFKKIFKLDGVAYDIIKKAAQSN